MDFEEQLEKAEKLLTPSLVGSSIRSADDSLHNNYIHPEKYKNHNNHAEKRSNHRLLNQSISASLDDLMSEGALLGSEEDFEKFLDDEGNVKEQARFVTRDLELSHVTSPLVKHFELNENEDSAEISDLPQESDDSSHHDEAVTGDAANGISEKSEVTREEETTSIYKQQDFSAPNLSDYQVENQINDHDSFISRVKSQDPLKLPVSNGDHLPHKAESPLTPLRKPRLQRDNSDKWAGNARDAAFQPGAREGLHVPYFQRDESSSARARADKSERSQSRSSTKRQLARDDSYKNTNNEEPLKYGLPSYFPAKKDVDEEDDMRRTRFSKPTMGESIAAAEASQKEDLVSKQFNINMEREPSLITTGDYTNFDVDDPEISDGYSKPYAGRSASSTNYLRSISRSRSRVRTYGDYERSSSAINEKNDADPVELAREGALITDDPYSTIGGLDAMAEEVWNLDEQSNINTEGESKATNMESNGDDEDSFYSKTDNANDNAEKGGRTTFAQEGISTNTSQSEDKVNNTLVIDPKEEDNIEDITDNSELQGKSDRKEEITETTHLAADKVDERDVEKDTIPIGKDIIDNVAEGKEAPVNNSLTTHENDMGNNDAEVKDALFDFDQTVTGNDIENTDYKNLRANLGSSSPDIFQEKSLDVENLNISGIRIGEAYKGAAIDKQEDVDTGIDVGEKVGVQSPTQNAAVSSTRSTSELELRDVEKSVDEEFDADALDISPEEIRKHLKSQPIYIFTSLAGGMQIMQRTNRLSTILTANGIKFSYCDLGTNEEAKKIWKRNAGDKLLPGIVRGDDFIGNLPDIEEANEEYRLTELLYETF